MMSLPLLILAPAVWLARAIRAICRRLRDWRARENERFYFGSLNEYEVDRLARDIGLGRAELLGDQLRPTRRSLPPPLPAGRDLPRPARPAAVIRPTDA